MKVKGRATSFLESLKELGLAVDSIKVSPIFKHRDIHCDDFGPDIPVDVMWKLAECHISMTLIHYSVNVLKACVNESMAGSDDGTLAANGTLMGAGKQNNNAKNHYISLNLLAPILEDPWHFPAAYLSDRPVEYPLGVNVQTVVMSWRAIPYVAYSLGAPQTSELKSKNAVLWDRVLD